MRYKTISLAIAVLLTATPICAQEKSYIIVETPRTAEPTTVITGQPFVQTYVVRFIDLTDSGEKIIVQEESLKSYKILGDFEVLGFSIDKETKQREFLEHTWYLRYTLRIINPEKKEYVIPSIEVPWKHKKAGQNENDPSILVNSDFKTDEVHITYATTIPKEEPYLEIRDELNFGNFSRLAWTWRVVSWFLKVVSIALWLIAFVAYRRSVRRGSKLKDKDIETADIGAGESIKTPSGLRAWFELRRSIRGLERCQISSSGQIDNYLIAKAEVVVAIKDFLRVKIPQLSIGSTSLNMAEYIGGSIDQYSTKKDAFFQLARKAVAYQTDVERKNGYSGSPLAEAGELKNILGQLRFHHRAVVFVRYNFIRARNRLAGKFRMRGK